jgi:hypothetical protein
MFGRAKPSGYAKGDKIEPVEINLIDVNQSRAVDGVYGGSYALVDKLSFGGTGGVEFAGTGAAAWPLLSPRIISRVQELCIGNVRLDAGSGNEPSAILSADASGNPVIRTPAAASPQAASSFWLVVRPPFNAVFFKEVIVRVAGTAATTTLNAPKFELIAYAPGVGVTPLSAIVTDAHAQNGSDWLVSLETTITPNVVHPVDRTKYLYFVRVTNPFGMPSTSMDVRKLVVRFDATTMEPS